MKHTIDTDIGTVGLTILGTLDSGEWAGNEAGSLEFTKNALQVFKNWRMTGLTQDEYFGAQFFVLTEQQEEALKEIS